MPFGSSPLIYISCLVGWTTEWVIWVFPLPSAARNRDKSEASKPCPRISGMGFFYQVLQGIKRIQSEVSKPHPHLPIVGEIHVICILTQTHLRVIRALNLFIGQCYQWHHVFFHYTQLYRYFMGIFPKFAWHINTVADPLVWDSQVVMGP